ncbi:dockerin type I domain-containing protein [Halorubrum kocurii]|uniref:dockerin type I domain-containing protein n=1 Tax=Halorubrum kocurii TaxID=478441 RepID=UPI000B2A374C|nr:dockerin type I domain-containing protein [Halorubrum kocurii]
MSNQWQVLFLVLLLVASLPGSAIAAGPSTTAQQATDKTSYNTTEGYRGNDTQVTEESYTPFDIEATANNSTIPWQAESPTGQDTLPVFVGDTVNFRIESNNDRYEIENVSWDPSGPANVIATTDNGSTAQTQFETHGKTSLKVTATLRDEYWNRTIERTANYTLIATSANFTVDEFSVEFSESSRWDKAGVYSHLHDLPDLHRNFSQRLPVPSRVNLLYANQSVINDRCGAAVYACVDQSNNNTITMSYGVGRNELSQTEVYEHELTHVAQFHGMDMRYRQPWRFIIEGHAEYEQSHQFNQHPLDEKPSQQELLELQVGYDAAALFVTAFIAEYGHQSLREMIELSASHSVDQAFQRTVNESYDSFYERWAPTNISRGPNAVRTVSSSSSEADKIHQKPRFVYYNGNLTALGFDSYTNTDNVTISWDTNNDGKTDNVGQTVTWTPAEEGDQPITVTYKNRNASLSRTQTVTISDVPLTSQDVDNDGLYEDVNGDGAFTISDIQALFANLDSDDVQQNPEAFDFNGDDDVTISDVQALFSQLN